MANAWHPYIKNIKDRAPKDMDTGCIIGRDGSIWADGDGVSRGICVKPHEAQAIARCFQKKQFSSMESNGFMINNQKFRFLRYIKDQDVVIGKAKGSGGMTLQGTKKAVLIAHCPEGCQMGNVNKAIGEIATHLLSAGF